MEARNFRIMSDQVGARLEIFRHLRIRFDSTFWNRDPVPEQSLIYIYIYIYWSALNIRFICALLLNYLNEYFF